MCDLLILISVIFTMPHARKLLCMSDALVLGRRLFRAASHNRWVKKNRQYSAMGNAQQPPQPVLLLSRPNILWQVEPNPNRSSAERSRQLAPVPRLLQIPASEGRLLLLSV